MPISSSNLSCTVLKGYMRLTFSRKIKLESALINERQVELTRMSPELSNSNDYLPCSWQFPAITCSRLTNNVTCCSGQFPARIKFLTLSTCCSWHFPDDSTCFLGLRTLVPTCSGHLPARAFNTILSSKFCSWHLPAVFVLCVRLFLSCSRHFPADWLTDYLLHVAAVDSFLQFEL